MIMIMISNPRTNTKHYLRSSQDYDTSLDFNRHTDGFRSNHLSAETITYHVLTWREHCHSDESRPSYTCMCNRSSVRIDTLIKLSMLLGDVEYVMAQIKRNIQWRLISTRRKMGVNKHPITNTSALLLFFSVYLSEWVGMVRDVE